MRQSQITEWCHFMIRSQAVEGGTYIDGTMGNGHDTLLLCELAGKKGSVWAFDVQEQALRNTKALLAAIPEPDLSKRDEDFVTIKGEVSSPINVKPGCRFAKRCEFCTEECTKADPEFREVSPNHFVACFKVK